MLELINEIDGQMLMAVNSLHTPFLDGFMKACTGRWIWVPMYVFLAWYLVKQQGWRNGVACIVAIGLAVAISDQTCATFIRPMVERLRPTHSPDAMFAAIQIVDGYRGGMYGFPSCHAANSAALAAFFMFLGPRTPVSLMLVGWALLNCYTRMYLGVHFPGDLAVGAVIGTAAAWLCYMGVRRLLHVPRIIGRRYVAPVLGVVGVSLIGIIAYSLVR